MKFGYFDDEKREYVITRPDVPLPWINYLGSEDFFGLISNTAGGYCFYRDARLRRLLRYRYNNVPTDTGGRYLYLRDNDTGQFWSPTWQPTRNALENYRCRHGMGYTNIQSSYRGLESEVSYFIPQGESLEVWNVHLKNTGDTEGNYSLFSCVEFALWDAQDDATNFQRNFNIGEVEVENGVIYHKTEYRERRDHFAYFACSAPLKGYDTQRSAFLGPYAGWDAPTVVAQGVSQNSVAHGWAPIGSHHVQFSLAPGEELRLAFLLGYHENPQDDKFEAPGSQTIQKRYVRKTIEKYLQFEEIDAAYAEMKQRWDELLGKFQVDTPDVETNRMINIWNTYQCMVTFNMSRSASYFESGVGRGMGFRDSAQDLLGFVHIIPERARERILDLAATQMESGGAYHQYQPLTKRGNDAVGSNFNDDPAWLVLAVAAYLKETGDWSILDEQVVFNNRPGSERPLYEHLQRCVHYTQDRLGPHGLPLIGRADWNDCLNLNCFSDAPGQSFQTTTNKQGNTAESVLIAGLFVLEADELAGIAAARGLTEDAARYQQAAEKMRDTVMAHGWDGDWFLRAYDDASEPVGSHTCDEGQIFIEPQGICVMAGMGVEDGRAAKALDSVADRLATEHGIVLLQPAYKQYYLNLGEISSYPPGYKENGSVFCHTNPWIMTAEATLGHGDKAFDYYKRINPAAREAISEVHRSEPYVYAQTIAGREAATFGEAKNSWLTGTAAWNFVAISNYILGIQPRFDGLRIAPVVPESWGGFSVVRVFRGVRYDIQVERVGKGNAVRLVVDGKAIEGNVISLPADNVNPISVEVQLGN
jgi:cellobiose phosphorylase